MVLELLLSTPWTKEGKDEDEIPEWRFFFSFFSDFHCLPKIFSGQEMVCEESLEAVERGGRSSRLGV